MTHTGWNQTSSASSPLVILRTQTRTLLPASFGLHWSQNQRTRRSSATLPSRTRPRTSLMAMTHQSPWDSRCSMLAYWYTLLSWQLQTCLRNRMLGWRRRRAYCESRFGSWLFWRRPTHFLHFCSCSLLNCGSSSAMNGLRLSGLSCSHHSHSLLSHVAFTLHCIYLSKILHSIYHLHLLPSAAKALLRRTRMLFWFYPDGKDAKSSDYQCGVRTCHHVVLC